ncbi:phosphodiesterase [Streptomyces clavifer]|uniref:phosphodiesterase n=1 Tax=Streptomyces clavifer TaxID=68188 RepID=UPI0036632796
MTVSIAHLSDPHLKTGSLAGAPAEGLYRALGRVLTIDPAPDCVVITGDLVDRGGAEDYRALREVIERFPLPLHLVAGNHDEPRALLDEFAGTRFMGDGTEARYAVDYAAFTLVTLDSTVPASPGGHLGATQLRWLDEVLRRRPQVPAVICLHHPPMAVGIPYLDGMGLDDGKDLADVLARHGNVVRVLAGHVHRSITAPFAGSTLAIAPSTHLQSGLALQGGIPDFVPEPTSFLLHLLAGSSWVTHSVAVSHAAGPVATF